MKKRLTFFVTIMLIISMLMPTLFAVPASANYNNEVEFKSDIVYLVNLDKGTVIFSKNADKKTAMASLTKITTCLVVLENCKNLDDKVTVKQSSLDILAGTNSSTAGITAGEVLTVRQLLFLMMVKSANEATCILADYVAGDIDTFVTMMNNFAKERGCVNTHYANTHGLDEDNHYTTAKDLAIIMEYGLKNETFCELIGTVAYTLPDTNKRESIKYTNTNSLMLPNSTYYYEPCKGGKTGTTENAGNCLASYASQNGYTYLCIIIGAPSEDVGKGYKENFAFRDSKTAYSWAFTNMKLKIVADPNDVVTDVPIKLGRKTDHIRLVPKEEVDALIPASAELSSISIEPIEGSIKEDIKAPIKAGTVLGKAKVKYAGETIGTVDLVAGENVSLSIIASIGYAIKSVFTSKFMKVVYILIALCILAILLLRYYNLNLKKKNKIRIVRNNKNPKISPNTEYRRRYKRQNEIKRKKK